MKKADVTIDMDLACKKCGKKGGTENGLCLRCITETIRPSNGDQVKRLLQLLRDIDTLDAQKVDYLNEYKKDKHSLHKAVEKLRLDIETGQKSLYEEQP
jgi:hypothetical protein